MAGLQPRAVAPAKQVCSSSVISFTSFGGKHRQQPVAPGFGDLVVALLNLTGGVSSCNLICNLIASGRAQAFPVAVPHTSMGLPLTARRPQLYCKAFSCALSSYTGDLGLPGSGRTRMCIQ